MNSRFTSPLARPLAPVTLAIALGGCVAQSFEVGGAGTGGGGGSGGGGSSGQGGASSSTATTSTNGTSATTGSTGAGGSGECKAPGDCEQPPGDCRVATCKAGTCGVENQPPGEPCANETKVCDGEGKCVDPCTEDETRCAPLGEKVEKCKNGVWTVAETCAGDTNLCFDPPPPSSDPATCWDGKPRASIDTTNGYVEFNNTTEGPDGTLTVATWLKSGPSNTGGILLANGKGGSYCSSIELSFVPAQPQMLATRFNVWSGGGGDKCVGSVFPLNMWPTSAVTFPAQAWTHLAVTKEAGAVKVFVNGSQAGAFNGMNFPPYTPANRDFWLGAGMNVSGAPVVNFAGRVAHFQIWSRVLSAAEIAKVASRAGAMPTDMSELYGYWPFDEGSGTLAHDAGPNGRDGTLSADNLW